MATETVDTPEPAPEDRVPETAPKTRSRPSVWPSLGLGVLLGLVLTVFSISLLGQYSYGAFVIAPFLSALTAAVSHGRRYPDDHDAFMRITGIMAGLPAMLLLLVLFRFEGMICVLMAIPVMAIPALVGALVGQVIGQILGQRRQVPVLFTVVLLYPAGEYYAARNPPVDEPRVVETTLLVRASPAVIWQELMQPVNYPSSVGWFFRAGVAYPTRTAPACFDAQGRPRALAVAYSHGTALLKLTAWEPARRLSFTIPAPPAPMRELSPYPDVHAPHLHGYFRVDEGTFALQPQPDGTTRLTARTVYYHRIGPRAYWGKWTDYFFDELHTRVLTELAHRAERHAGH